MDSCGLDWMCFELHVVIHLSTDLPHKTPCLLRWGDIIIEDKPIGSSLGIRPKEQHQYE